MNSSCAFHRSHSFHAVIALSKHHLLAGRGIFYPLLNGVSKGDVVVLTKRMFDDDDEMVLGKWMASLGRILL